MFGVAKNFGLRRILLRPLPFLLERLVEVVGVLERLDVAPAPRVPVPVPGAAEVATLLDDAKVLDAGLAQACAGELAAEALLGSRSSPAQAYARAVQEEVVSELVLSARARGTFFSPIVTRGRAVSGRYTSTREPKRMKP